jgi:hypothetical protein
MPFFCVVGSAMLDRHGRAAKAMPAGAQGLGQADRKWWRSLHAVVTEAL